jgi:hypothetical protein
LNKKLRQGARKPMELSGIVTFSSGSDNDAVQAIATVDMEVDGDDFVLVRLVIFDSHVFSLFEGVAPFSNSDRADDSGAPLDDDSALALVTTTAGPFFGIDNAPPTTFSYKGYLGATKGYGYRWVDNSADPSLISSLRFARSFGSTSFNAFFSSRDVNYSAIGVSVGTQAGTLLHVTMPWVDRQWDTPLVGLCSRIVFGTEMSSIESLRGTISNWAATDQADVTDQSEPSSNSNEKRKRLEQSLGVKIASHRAFSIFVGDKVYDTLSHAANEDGSRAGEQLIHIYKDRAFPVSIVLASCCFSWLLTWDDFHRLLVPSAERAEIRKTVLINNLNYSDRLKSMLVFWLYSDLLPAKETLESLLSNCGVGEEMQMICLQIILRVIRQGQYNYLNPKLDFLNILNITTDVVGKKDLQNIKLSLVRV